MNGAPRTRVVVGDRFPGFAAHDSVVTVSQFLTQLRAGGYAEGSTVVRAGQGVGDFEWHLLREQVRVHGLEFRVRLVRPEGELVSRAECHKRSEPNALIAGLHQVDEQLFRASLRLHNDNELLLDHQTGQHVQGMVAVEAARQMFLAVTERFFASAHPGRHYYYVIESLNTDFENFLFPLDARIDYRVQDAKVDDPERLWFSAEIGLLQAGRRASVTRVTFSAFDEQLLKPKEHRRAARAVAHAAAELLVPEPAGV
ncbi:AfsA-related hotdog domain-containing protein [Streptomyces sp. NPDC093600]|uniref:AfsA-related hotdog domain-containing protein n=1 Tax=Streptomyces sp. NPDC093600 TaxID=3366047 RepID=UPI003810CDC7